MISEQSAEYTVGVLELFYSIVIRSVESTGGTIDKLMGDTVMAFWNAPLPVQKHYREACSAALVVQSRLMEAYEDFNKGLWVPRIRVRAGIHCGTCLVGNLGSFDRLNYTAYVGKRWE